MGFEDFSFWKVENPLHHVFIARTHVTLSIMTFWNFDSEMDSIISEGFDSMAVSL